MPENPESIISAQLSAGERLYWTGQPPSGIRFRPQDALLIPFSLLWTSFAFSWEAGVTNIDAPLLFRLWGIPFMLVGVYLTIGRFFGDAYLRSRTFYGVTSERIIIVSGFFSREVKSLNLRTLTDLSLSERANGSGMIWFGNPPPMAGFFAGTSWPGAARALPPAFDLPAHAREVYETIRNAQRTAV